MKLLIIFTLVYLSFQTCLPAQCKDVTCGLDIGYNMSRPLSCTESDFSAKFSSCDQGVKNLFYYWKPPATCTGATLPSPILDIPCELSCLQGQYFNSTTRGCETCLDGLYSSELLSYTTWKAWPNQMKTSCSNTDHPCSPWRLNGKFIDSGKNMDGVMSELTMNVELIRPGMLEFAYFVDAELNYDYLAFYLDNVQKLKSSRQLSFKPVTFNVTKGYHQMRWVYSKDYSVSRGEDIAKISYIRLDGVLDVEIQCGKCPEGTYRNGEMKTCELCKENTFARDAGTSQCENCPFGEESFPGATECFPSSQPCRQSDISSKFGACVNSRHTQTYFYIAPVLCNMSHPNSVPIPPPVVADCENTCAEGQVSSTEGCVYCPSGQYRGVDSNTCQTCQPGGHINTENHYISEFLPGNTIFTTGCTGSCKSGGWRMAGNFTDSGLGNGVSESWISLTVDLKKQGSVRLDHQLSCLDKAGTLAISVDGAITSVAQCGGCSAEFTNTVIRLQKGVHTIKTTFTTSSGYSSDWTCDRVTIKSITIQNSVLVGGGINCVDCPGGTKSVDPYTCDACPIGFFSGPRSIRCQECADDTFSPNPGTEVCASCGAGFQARVSPRSKCVWTLGACQFSQYYNNTMRIFDFSPLVPKIQDTLYPWKGNQWQINLDMDHMFCMGFICELRNRTYYPVSDTASLLYQGQTGGQAIVMNTKSMNRRSNDTRITLWCMSNTGREFDPEKDVSISEGQIDIYSQYGCPLCQRSDYEENVGTCISGKRNIIYRKISSCSRGYSMNVTSVECTNTIRFPYWAIIIIPLIAIVILISLIVVVVILFMRYRKLQNKYSMLMDSRRDNDINDDGDDDMPNGEIVNNNVVNARDVVSTGHEVDEYEDLKL